MEEQRIEYKLSINSCFKALDRSFSRVKYFSCIASNLNFEGFPTSWQIQNPSGLNYMVSTPKNEEEQQIILESYKHFMHCYLVRDCIESFAISLDRLFLTLLVCGKKVLTGQTLYDVLNDEEKKALKNFDKVGLSSKKGKIFLFKKHFGIEISDEHKDIIDSLKDIRNCFAHGNGFVRSSDGKEVGSEERKFTWRTISIFAKGEESGREFPIVFDKLMPEAGMISMRLENHQKLFKVRQQLSFTPAETYEIAFSLQQVARNLMKEIGEKFQVEIIDEAA